MTPARAFTAVFITQHLAIGGASEHHNEVRALEDKSISLFLYCFLIIRTLIFHSLCHMIK